MLSDDTILYIHIFRQRMRIFFMNDNKRIFYYMGNHKLIIQRHIRCRYPLDSMRRRNVLTQSESRGDFSCSDIFQDVDMRTR